jgi:hypothetical protein
MSGRFADSPLAARFQLILLDHGAAVLEAITKWNVWDAARTRFVEGHNARMLS